jgi:hypothetical protein
MARKDRDMPDGATTPASFSTVDEQSKAKVKASALAEAAKKAQEADLQAAEDEYYTKKDSQGKTQAQRDALKNALKTAEEIRNTSATKSAYVDPKTGKVVTMGKGSTVETDPIISVVDNGDGTVTTTYKSGKKITNKGYNTKSDDSANKKVYTASDGREFTDQQAFVDYEISLREANLQKGLIAEQGKAERRSAYDLLLSEFKNYGLEALVTPLKSLIEEGVSPSEFTLRLRETDAYKKRFAANAQRVAKGLRALSEAEYIGTEDQYQDVMRRYGMPESYYAKGDLGVQTGFEKFLAGDVSAVELEDRIQTAQNRVVNSNPEVAKALKEFYPGISNGDILAYVLDPTNAIEQIKRKVTAAEIGGAAIQSGLRTGMARAEELGAAGITKQQAQQGFGTIAGGLQRGSQLASIYGEDPYSQAIAETEVFGLAGKTEAEKQRKKLTGLEKATFGGQTGLTTGALSQERAGAY